MGSLVTDPATFLRLFADFHHAAFKLEVRRSYGVPSEDEPFQVFLAGGDPGVGWLRPWLDLMRAETAKGKRVERVRVVDEPPSDYLRFEMSVTPHNIAAGEDIRYLDRRRATELALPQYDFWLFDSQLVAFLHFTDDDQFVGFRTTEDPAEVLKHCQCRDRAWTRAIPFSALPPTVAAAA
ncbi:DUF6879 family protein [Micromonospora sp. RL09-050-HVF-A]|uniref:DUF6879 family protein n=1 Tax=Micromonospora sp. RL09-050-HVF-A TaxID=1703433 RepID=UPI001C5E62A8|nr:DUF6879 family protein [Micromonospora sp. RL09-050-HVF-A]MBW4702600.1 hypothetical protein [Micromonospora sp. RL09-050-HVF-A]